MNDARPILAGGRATCSFPPTFQEYEERSGRAGEKSNQKGKTWKEVTFAGIESRRGVTVPPQLSVETSSKNLRPNPRSNFHTDDDVNGVALFVVPTDNLN